jgi:hypothetical protein
VQFSNRLRELLAMQDVVLWNTGNCRGQLGQNASEQTEVDVHVNRFADILSAWPFEDQCEASPIEMRLKSGRVFECTNIEFVRNSSAISALSGTGLVIFAPRQ